MSRMVSPSINRAYGVAMFSRLWRIDRTTVYRHRRPYSNPRARGSLGPLPDDEPGRRAPRTCSPGVRSTAKATGKSGRGSASLALEPER